MGAFAVLCVALFSAVPTAHVGSPPTSGKWWRALPPGATLASLPMSIERAKSAWVVGPGLKVVHDEVIDTPVLEHSGGAVGFLRSKQPVEGPCEILALVRITEEKAPHHGATLACGVTGESASPRSAYALDAYSAPTTGRFCLTLAPSMGTPESRAYQTPRPPIEDPIRIQWPHAATLSDRFRDISPTWDEAFRLEIEAAMARVPLVHKTWFTLRIEIGVDAVRLWKDGFLVAERRPPGRIAGDLCLLLRGNVRVGALGAVCSAGFSPSSRTRPEGRTTNLEGFCPVRLGGACNAAAGKLLDSAAIPHFWQTVSVAAIPFEFPQPKTGGSDHVDVGESLFHYRNQSGYFDANTTWPEPGSLDPARIRFSVPNRPWRRLWLVAASDGQPNKAPIVTARFYRPRAGFAVDAAAEVPTLTARSARGVARAGGTGVPPVRLPVTLADGKSGSLWLVPIELDSVTIASRFREEHTLSLELTKQVHDWRAYPDPCVYDRFQGGPPSGVRI
ncbi:MAG: hypothetical protein FJ291_12240, partial [Planctomycetes bacterium]|nr:hypothetical protein [Planctomycetota bacterium]